MTDHVIDLLQKQLKRITPRTILARAVTSEMLEIASDLNRDQLSKGELNNSEKVGKYSKSTEGYNSYRNTKVSSSDTIKFYDTGAFHKSIKGKINKDGELQMTSRSRKLERLRAYLEDKGYEGDLLGLTDENLERWFETFVRDAYVKALEERILNFQ
jgi:hypothetical protein